MRKVELIKEIAKKSELEPQTVKLVLDTFMDVVSDCLFNTGEDIFIQKFGVFYVRDFDACVRNPNGDGHTKAPCHIPRFRFSDYIINRFRARDRECRKL